MLKCETCKGRKWVEESDYVAPSGTVFESEGPRACPDCNGTGDELMRLQIQIDDAAETAKGIIDDMIDTNRQIIRKLTEVIKSFQEN